MAKPFAWYRYQQGSRVYYDLKDWEDCLPLYKYPKEWVDLTRTQMQDVYFAVLEKHRGDHQMAGQLAFGEALQAKLKEKNT